MGSTQEAIREVSDSLPGAPIPDQATPLAPEQARFSLLLRSALAFVAGFALSVGVIRLFVIRDPLRLYTPDLSEKTTMLAHLPATPSAAFGSSMTHLGFDPRVFDQTLQGTSLVGRSMNLGVSAGTQTEARVMAKYYLQHLPSTVHPCLLLFEANEGPQFTLQWMEHPREINEFDLESAKIVLEFPPEPTSSLRRWHNRMALLVSVTLHYLNTGMLSNLFFRPSMRRDEYTYETDDDRRGLYAPLPTYFTRKIVAQAFQDRPAIPQVEARPFARGNVHILEDINGLLPYDKMRFVVFVLPSLNDLYVYGDYPSSIQTSFGAVPVIDLARPDLYPQFYAPDLWFDKVHLNAEGAKLVTAELAHQVRAWYAAHPPAPNSGCKG